MSARLQQMAFNCLLMGLKFNSGGKYVDIAEMKKTPVVPGFVPKTGFEPARRFQRYHLKVVRLPISPPGQQGDKFRDFFY